MIRKAFNIVFLLGLIPWALIFLLSFMLFDAPGSQLSVLTQGLFYSIASYPALVAVGFFAGNGFWRRRDERHWRRHLAFLPLISPLLSVLFFLAIDVFCSGRLSCKG